MATQATSCHVNSTTPTHCIRPSLSTPIGSAFKVCWPQKFRDWHSTLQDSTPTSRPRSATPPSQDLHQSRFRKRHGLGSGQGLRLRRRKCNQRLTTPVKGLRSGRHRARGGLGIRLRSCQKGQRPLRVLPEAHQRSKGVLFGDSCHLSRKRSDLQQRQDRRTSSQA